MGHAIGDAVRLRPGSERAERFGAAAELTGQVGDSWTDPRGERVNVVYEALGFLAVDQPAADFVPDVSLGAAPF